MEAESDSLNERVIELTKTCTNVEATLREEKPLTQVTSKHSSIRGEIEKNFKNIATDTLKANEQSFLTLANEVFEKHKEASSTDLETEAKAVDELVAPIVEMLNSYKQRIEEGEKAR